jgi:hypothetical protein
MPFVVAFTVKYNNSTIQKAVYEGTVMLNSRTAVSGAVLHAVAIGGVTTLVMATSGLSPSEWPATAKTTPTTS